MPKNRLLLPQLTVALLSLGCLMLPNSLQAQTSSKTATATATTTSSASPSATTQNLRDRIEKIVEEKRDQIKGVLDEFDQKKRGTLGNVTRVSEESITIKTRKATEIIPLTSDVVIEKAGKSIKIGDIAVGDWAVVMGIIDNDTFVPKRVLVSSTSLRPATPVVTLGTITKVERTQLEVTPRSGDSAFSIVTNTKTTYQDIKGDEIERADLKTDMQALVIGVESTANEKTARIIRVLTVVEADKS
jgi:hypothetical protein